ncbi:alcohol dehydrogenase [Fusarium coicis]|nr:alcohol dehydrogenase [Fusarium coicis]
MPLTQVRNLRYLEAATLPCSALRAWNALYGLKAVLPGDWVLTQGTGGVSISALQFAKTAGARVVATTSSAAKAQKLRKLGADHVINYKEIPNWGEEAKRLTEGGVDHVLEVGGTHTITESQSWSRNRSFDIKPILDERLFKLEELKDAYQYLVDQKHFSKVAI